MEHPITPPDELVQQWRQQWACCPLNRDPDLGSYIANQASHWGWVQRGAATEAELQQARDEELEACCKWTQSYAECGDSLRAARPLLEQVARLGDCIGANTVGKIMAISSRAAAWLEANPPGQPVAIEPRGCPTPGACSCVEPATPLPKKNTKPGFINVCVEGLPPTPYENWEDWLVDTFENRTIQGVYIRALISGDFPFDKKEAATPPPEPPTDGEVGELVAELRKTATKLDNDRYHHSARIMRSAAELLERTATPPPEPDIPPRPQPTGGRQIGPFF